MKRNLPQELHKKLNEKYKYLFLTKQIKDKPFKDIFFSIFQDVFVTYSHMAIRFQIISDAIGNIEKTPEIYNKHKDKFKALLMNLNEIIDASNFISYKLYAITKLFETNTNE